MKIPSPIPSRRARIEVIPLIDIMFFLLAAFVLVSLTMVRQLTISVDLPVVTEGEQITELEPIAVAVDALGNVYLGEQSVSLEELRAQLQTRLAQDPNLPVTVSGDSQTTHGAMVSVLEYIRSIGVQRIAFAVRLDDTAKATP